MERHKCRLCFRTFSNGRALGGHMKGHLAALPLPPKTTHQQLSHHAESPSSLSSSSGKELDREDKNREELEEKSVVYGLRENPKKSFRLADPEFSFAADSGSIVQDGESETESRNKTRRRSKRSRKPTWVESAAAEPEPGSSVSIASQEEAVAICLMMLSRDVWKSGNGVEEAEQEVKTTKKARKNGKEIEEKDKTSECRFCVRVFGSGTELEGHKRTSHLLNSLSSSTNLRNSGKNLIDLNLPAPMEDDELSVVSEA